MTYFYVSAIFLAALAICLFFAIRKDRQDKRLNDFKRDKILSESLQDEKISLEEEKEEKKEEKKEEAEKQLESFSLENEKEKEEQKDEEEELSDEEEQKSFEESFAEYERFLKENNINLDDLEDDDDEQEDDSNTKTIDMRDFEGKSRPEIMEMLSNYSEQEQKIILENLLGKKED